MVQLALPDTSLQTNCICASYTENKIHCLPEVEAQLTELEDHLEDAHMTRVAQQVTVLRLKLRPIKAQLRLQLTIQMVQMSNQLHNHFRRWNRLPLVDLQFF